MLIINFEMTADILPKTVYSEMETKIRMCGNRLFFKTVKQFPIT